MNSSFATLPILFGLFLFAGVNAEQPNHLVPIPAYDRDGYNQAVFQSLIGQKRSELWMITKPSFMPERAVILRHILSATDDPFADKFKSGKWFVEWVEAKKQIWQWKKLDGGRMQFHIAETDDLNKSSVEVSHEFAASMIDAWRSVLIQTRYLKGDYRGLDGTTFQFCCDYDFFGEIWSPQTGLPKLITELGIELGELAKAKPESREEHMNQCLKLAKSIRTQSQSQKKPSPVLPKGKAKGR